MRFSFSALHLRSILKKSAFPSILILLNTAPVFAQVNRQLLYLNLNPSTELSAIGSAGVAYHDNDPSGFYLNPAKLGLSFGSNRIAVQFNPERIKWYGGNYVSSRNFAINAGYDFSTLLNGTKVYAGIGYLSSRMSYSGNFGNGSGDWLDAFSFGAGIDLGIKIYAGVTFKNYISKDFFFHEIEPSGTIKTYLVDYGFFLDVPVSKLLFPGANINFNDEIDLVPIFNFSAGYSQLNLGDKARFSESYYHYITMPLPRTALAGYSLSAGINAETKHQSFNLFEYDFSTESEDLLLDSLGNYQNFLGNIEIGRNIIGLKNNKNVVIHKGHRFELLETYGILLGRTYDLNNYNNKSYGFEITSRGLFLLLGHYFDNSFFNFLSGHFNIRFIKAYLFVDTPVQTQEESLTFSLSNYIF